MERCSGCKWLARSEKRTMAGTKMAATKTSNRDRHPTEPSHRQLVATTGEQLPAENRAGHLGESVKITDPNLLALDLSVSDLKSGSLAGYFRLIRSILCTRHIQKKLTPRGHHDWPYKATSRSFGLWTKPDGPRHCSETGVKRFRARTRKQRTPRTS